MPFAGFKNFDDCLTKLKSKYPKIKTRKKVCGALQAKHEHKHERLVFLKEEIAKEKEFLEDIGKELKTIKEEVK